MRAFVNKGWNLLAGFLSHEAKPDTDILTPRSAAQHVTELVLQQMYTTGLI